MTTKQMDEMDGTLFPKCWAFNTDGLRCMQTAGHAGKHAHAIEWSDDECAVPTAIAPALVGPPEPVREARPQRIVCMICDHAMHEGPCAAMDGEFPCDCSQGIPG